MSASVDSSPRGVAAFVAPRHGVVARSQLRALGLSDEKVDRWRVELDGYQFHGTRAAFERDRRKDAALLAAGYRTMRLTWRRLAEEPLRVAAELGATLRA